MPEAGPGWQSLDDPRFSKQWGKKEKAFRSEECARCGRKMEKWWSHSKWEPERPYFVRRFRKCYCEWCFKRVKDEFDLTISHRGNKFQPPYWTQMS